MTWHIQAITEPFEDIEGSRTASEDAANSDVVAPSLCCKLPLCNVQCL